MNLLIKSAIVVNQSELNGKKIDILIEKGIIKKIASKIGNPGNYQEIKEKDLHVSIGWMDFRANFCDPGFEYKEDLSSGLKAAANGGFTEVVVMPNTQPVIDSKANIDYLLNKSKGDVVKLHPTGCLSEKMEGKDISEMYDMFSAGAVAFTDNKQSINSSSLLNRALLYTQGFGGLVINFPNDQELFNGGQMNEGVTNTKLGLKGIPTLAEELMVSRDLFLAEYCNSKIHLSNISSKKSVELIKAAKKKGVKVTADVNSYHLLLDESELETFDSNLKVLPPLRTKEDIKALIKGIKDGTIDVICSDHTPEDIENKQCEFDHASFGITNIETSFSAMNTAMKNKVELTDYITTITDKPRKVLNLEIPQIKEGELANLTLFSPNSEIIFQGKNLKSKSKNNPFVGRKLTGHVVGIVNNNKVNLN